VTPSSTPMSCVMENVFKPDNCRSYLSLVIHCYLFMSVFLVLASWSQRKGSNRHESGCG